MNAVTLAVFPLALVTRTLRDRAEIVAKGRSVFDCYHERDIKHEATGGRYWVLDTGKAYAVMVVGVTHSTSDSAYERTPDGLSIAIARCDYLAARRGDTHL